MVQKIAKDFVAHYAGIGKCLAFGVKYIVSLKRANAADGESGLGKASLMDVHDSVPLRTEIPTALPASEAAEELIKELSAAL